MTSQRLSLESVNELYERMDEVEHKLSIERDHAEDLDEIDLSQKMTERMDELERRMEERLNRHEEMIKEMQQPPRQSERRGSVSSASKSNLSN